VFYTLAILNAASIFGRISPNFLADYFGSLNLLTIMCYGAGFLCFSVLGAGSFGGLIVVAIIFGFFSGAYVSLMTPAIITLSKGPHEIGIRLGTGFLITSFAALTGTPITGALLDKYGFVAPVVWSGVTVLAGAMCFTVATLLQRRVKGNWKV
jgi:MFS family permease